MTFSGGNGGATSPGVTDGTVRVAVRIGSFSNGMLDALSKVAKAQIPDESPDVITRTIEGLAEYFNRTVTERLVDATSAVAAFKVELFGDAEEAEGWLAKELEALV